MVGRTYLHGPAAASEQGVDWVIEHLRTGMQRTWPSAAHPSVAEPTPELLIRRSATLG